MELKCFYDGPCNKKEDIQRISLLWGPTLILAAISWGLCWHEMNQEKNKLDDVCLFPVTADFLTELCSCCEAMGTGSETSSRPILALSKVSLQMEMQGQRPQHRPGPLCQLVKSGQIKLQRHNGKGAKRPPKCSLKIGNRTMSWGRGVRDFSLGNECVHMGRRAQGLLSPISFTSTVQALMPCPYPKYSSGNFHASAWSSAIHPPQQPPYQIMLHPCLKAYYGSSLPHQQLKTSPLKKITDPLENLFPLYSYIHKTIP